MRYQIFMNMLSVAMVLPGAAAQASELGSTWSAKTLSMSKGRAWMDGSNYLFHRTGLLPAGSATSLSIGSAANGGTEIGRIGDYLGNTSLFTDITPIANSAGVGPSVSTPSPVTRSTESATEGSVLSNAGPSSDPEGYMTLLAGVGVIGFLAFKRGGARSRY